MVSNEEILSTIKQKIEEKNEVITEQQLMIDTLSTQVSELEAKVQELEQAESARAALIDQINELD